MSLDSIPDIVEDIKSGKPVILVDDEDRENEGDLIIAADYITPQLVNFMATEARGLICLALTNDQGRQNLDYVHGMPGDLGEDAMLAQHLGHDHLGEKNFVDLVQNLPPHLELQFLRFLEFNRDNQALPAHFLDE